MTATANATGAMFSSLNEVESFALAGNATLTVVSKFTGKRITFSFRRPDPLPGKARPTWVSIADPTKPEAFVGTLWGEHGNYSLRRSAKSNVADDAPAVRLLEWLVLVLNARTSKATDQAEFWHEGRCGRCGRPLTVPESIASGLGPECSRRVGPRAA